MVCSGSAISDIIRVDTAKISRYSTRYTVTIDTTSILTVLNKLRED